MKIGIIIGVAKNQSMDGMVNRWERANDRSWYHKAPEKGDETL